MENLLTANLVWAIINFLIIGFYFFAATVQQGVNVSKTLTFIFAIVYLVCCVQAKKSRKWALAAVYLITFILAVRWAPMVFINTYMFYSGHELYVNSPATIFVVVIYAVLFAIPSLFFTVAYAVRYKEIIRRLTNSK